MLLPPAEALVVAGATSKLISGRGLLKGWSLRNISTTAACTFKLHDGDSANGNLLVDRQFLASQSITDWLAEMGVIFLRGVFIEATGTGCSGALYVIPETRLPQGWDEIGGWSGD